MRIFSLVGVLLLLTSLYLAASVPVFGDDTGIVNATVSVQDVPCITVGTTNIPYGQKAFSTTQGLVSATSTITNVDSCSTAPQTVLAAGSTATATGVTWNLAPTLNCTSSPTDQYRHVLRNTNTATDLVLSLTLQPLATFAASQQDVNFPTTLNMPCTGSAGAGKTMTMQVTLTATVP